MKKKHVFLIIFLLMFFIGIQNSKTLASFYIQNFEINSEILSNGDMKVEENITYYSNETKNGVTRKINIKNSNNKKNSADSLTLTNVKVDGKVANKVLSGNLGDDGVYEYTSSGNLHNFKVYAPFRGAQTRTVTYEYILKNVGVRYNDTSEIYWNFIGDEWDTSIYNLNININLPKNAANGTIYVFGHGSDEGTFTKDRNYITLTARNLLAYQPIDARILFPVDALSNSTKNINQFVLDKYINQEEGLSNKREEPKILLGLNVKEIATMLSIIIVLIGIIIYFMFDKEIKVKKQYYYRDIPCDLEPELLQTIYYGKKCKDSFWIAFLNLVKMGIYKIEETTNKVGKKVNLITYQETKRENLKDYQSSLITTINGFFTTGTKSIDLDTLSSKMKKSTGYGYKKFVDKLETQMESYFGDNTKVSKKPATFCVLLMVILIIFIGIVSFKVDAEFSIGIAMFLGFTTFIYSIFFSKIPFNLPVIIFLVIHFSAFQAGIIGMMISGGVGWLYMPYIILFFLMQYTQRIKKSSKEERHIKEQIKGLRRYLRHYSKIQERTLESMVIWEDYLIIAIALKLNKKTINYFYDYCKDNLGNEFGNSLNSFGTYHYMNIACRTTFTNYLNSYARTTSSSSGGSSFSGSSGGFSGGSSSGGGGRRRGRKLILKKIKWKDGKRNFMWWSRNPSFHLCLN